MEYRLKVGDVSYTTDDLTLEEAIAIEKATGQSWLHMSNPLRSAELARAILVAFVSRTEPPEVARVRVAALTVRDVAAMIEPVEGDMPEEFVDGIPDPKRVGEPKTNGLSGSPTDTTGRQTL